MDKNGNIVSAQDYYPYGGIPRSYSTGGNSINDRYKFTQKERDQETGYDYFGARYYDSGLGRWMTPDPIDDPFIGNNSYIYSMDNTQNFIDPNGKFSINTIKGYGTYFTVMSSAAVNWAIYGFGKKYNDNIFPDCSGLNTQDMITDVAIDQFDRFFGTYFGVAKTVYTIVKTITTADDIFFKWQADNILFDQIQGKQIDNKQVFLNKQLCESNTKYNKTGFQFLNGFKWLEFNPDLLNDTKIFQ